MACDLTRSSASTVSVFSVRARRRFLTQCSWISFYRELEIGALPLRRVISSLHILLKSIRLSYKRSWKVGATKSRCTVIGISVAESCGIPGTGPDSFSVLLSSWLPSRPQLSPSALVTLHTQTVRPVKCRAGLQDRNQGSHFSLEKLSIHIKVEQWHVWRWLNITICAENHWIVKGKEAFLVSSFYLLLFRKVAIFHCILRRKNYCCSYIFSPPNYAETCETTSYLWNIGSNWSSIFKQMVTNDSKVCSCKPSFVML